MQIWEYRRPQKEQHMREKLKINSFVEKKHKIYKKDQLLNDNKWVHLSSDKNLLDRS